MCIDCHRRTPRMQAAMEAFGVLVFLSAFAVFALAAFGNEILAAWYWWAS